MNEVRLMLLHYLRGRDLFGALPNEIHLMMNSAQRESRLKNQKDAAIKKEAGADDSKRNWNDVVVLVVSESEDADGNAGRDKAAQAQIKDDHGSLQNTGATRQLIELLKNIGLSLRRVRGIV